MFSRAPKWCTQDSKQKVESRKWTSPGVQKKTRLGRRNHCWLDKLKTFSEYVCVCEC
jgi:hypothetical protein